MIHFPTTPPCSTRVDVLESGDVPFLFSLSQMKNLGSTFELDPKGDKITCPAFGLYSSDEKHGLRSFGLLREGHWQGRNPETARAREHEARRLATKSGALASTCKRSATSPRQKGAWYLYRRVPNFRRKKEVCEKDFKHKAVYDGRVDEKRLQEWTDEMQSKVQAAERQLEARERKWMELEDSSSQGRRAWEKLWEAGAFHSSPYLSSLPR